MDMASKLFTFTLHLQYKSVPPEGYPPRGTSRGPSKRDYKCKYFTFLRIGDFDTPEKPDCKLRGDPSVAGIWYLALVLCLRCRRPLCWLLGDAGLVISSPCPAFSAILLLRLLRALSSPRITLQAAAASHPLALMCPRCALVPHAAATS